MADSSPADTSVDPRVQQLLAAAVDGIGGAERTGQSRMAQAVWSAMADGQHLAVQAGTGTGKSLAYLVPALRIAADGRGPVIVSTATIALQRQLVERDLPRLTDTLSVPLGRAPRFAIFKGRGNYACKNRIGGAASDDGQDGLFDQDAFEPATPLGQQVKRLHEWANDTESGDRDELVPGVTDQAWRQVSVTARECVGASRCPFGSDCFSENARQKAAEADIVVTNHALLAIDALGDGVLPEHDIVVVDEAHELVDRVTSVATGEISATAIDVAARRAANFAPDTAHGRLTEAGNALSPLLTSLPAGRMDELDIHLGAALTELGEAARSCVAEMRAHVKKELGEDPAQQGAAQTAIVGLEDLAVTAERAVGSFEFYLEERDEVMWLERYETGVQTTAQLKVAPLEVGEVLAESLFAERSVVLTSATLTLGGSFEPLAQQWGLDPGGMGTEWEGLDVGSPFNHGRSGILYVARHLQPPGRDGYSDEYLEELWELIQAAGGRTLGLFSSMRAAKQATAALRD
ncbi:MAG: ATP-dependent DNA helicase, partial [Streptosporangiales bacterium]|nr:ATP-dependent DNA helicase [Streptosporangiales bacterium]